MASIFKLGRDKKKRHACWYIGYTDHTGKRRTKKGFTDKSLTEQLAARLENEAMLRKMGMIDPKQEQNAEKKNSSIEEHLEAYRKGMVGRGCTKDHIRISNNQIKRILEAGQMKTLAQIDAAKVESYLNDLRSSGKIGSSTFNQYLHSINAFCNWLVKRDWLERNPLFSLSLLNAKTDIRRRRRALTPDEMEKLIKAAQTSDVVIKKYTGEQRARCYLFSYYTGIRRKEMASLTPQSFDLNSTPPTVRIEATYSKHRKTDVLPLHPGLVSLLKDWTKELNSGEFLFPDLDRKATGMMVRKDLERAGIPYKDEKGRVADFHAAGRHSYITQLIRSGASIVEAKELARHADVRMTMRYTHIGIDDQAKALASLPTPKVMKDKNSCQHIVSIPTDIGPHQLTSPDTKTTPKHPTPKKPKPCNSRVSNTNCHKKSSPDTKTKNSHAQRRTLRTSNLFS